MVNTMIDFINKSPTAFSAISNIKKILSEKNYVELFEEEEYKIEKGGKYFVSRNNTSIIAFNVGKKLERPSLQICASHSDCPSFKLKPNPIIKTKNGIKLNVEIYGEALLRPWFDRPLSIAGRIIINNNGKVEPKEFVDDEPFCILASMAPHLSKDIEKNELKPEVDLLPIVSLKDDFDFNEYLSSKINIDKNSILGFDLYLYPFEKGYVWGNNEFITSNHIDNLECAFATLMGFVDNFNDENINVYACFDNEEVGSLTRQGAYSDFLVSNIQRLSLSLDIEFEQLRSRGIMLSCDNAHGLHPNHEDLYDKENAPVLNGGVVIKYNANQSYTTDSLSGSLFKKLLDDNNIPYQLFANKTGTRGGSTLGNLSNNQISLISIDVGLAQWAMHSPIETCGYKDVEYMVNAVKCFYKAHFSINKQKYSLGNI